MVNHENRRFFAKICIFRGKNSYVAMGNTQTTDLSPRLPLAECIHIDDILLGVNREITQCFEHP